MLLVICMVPSHEHVIAIQHSEGNESPDPEKLADKCSTLINGLKQHELSDVPGRPMKNCKSPSKSSK